MSNLLFIDTSGNLAAVASSKSGKLAAPVYHDDAKTQAVVLNQLIEDALRAAECSLQDIDAICVCAGPGSYTGLRVGLSIAKGIAYALDKKLLLFDKLSLIARSYKDSESEPGDKLVVLNARKDEVFFALFNAENEIIIEPQHAFLNAFIAISEIVNKKTTLLTEIENLPLPLNTIIIDASFKLSFESWQLAAEQRVAHKDFDDLAYSEPAYLKAAFMTQAKNNPLLNP